MIRTLRMLRSIRRRPGTGAALIGALGLAVTSLGCGHAVLEQRIKVLEVEADRQAVIRLIHQYAHGIDGHDEALLRQTFTADAVAEYKGVNFPMDVHLEGFAAILEWLNAQVGSREGAAPWHYMDTHLVEVKGHRATLKTFQHNRLLSGVGVYTVDAVRTSQGWRIQKLHLDERILDPKLLEQMHRNPVTPGVKPGGAPGSAPGSEPGAAVEQAEKRFVAALAGDVESLESLLARDFVYTTTTGSMLGKQALLDYLRSGATRVEHIVREDVQRTERDGLVLTTGRLTADVRQEGKASRIRSRYLHVWIPSADGWQLLARQAAALPDAPTNNPS
ncbi:nuclear transport factor 2 family protein [Myxococcota bacterium]|nr:nuclear transport factor 2 family protein [Myxococcota bacterium]